MSWWKNESAWERKFLYVFGFYLAPRQIVIPVVSIIFSFLITIPVPLLPRFIIIVIIVIMSFVYISIPVRAVPIEYQMLAAMGIIRLGAKPTVQKNVKGPKAAKTVNANETLTIDDFATAPLYWITGSQQVRSKSSLVLLVDNSEYAKVDLLPGTAGDYRFAYRAVSAHDLGTHTIALVLNGEKQKEWELTVKKRGLELIDTAA